MANLTSAVSKINLSLHNSKKQQIYDAVLDRIKNKSLPVGMRLPTTTQLAADWGVAQATAQAALSLLMKDGWLKRSPKFGTFISEPEKETATQAITLVLPHHHDIVSANFTDEVFEILLGLTFGARNAKQHTRVESISSKPTEKEEFALLQNLCSSKAVVFVGGTQYYSLIQKLLVQEQSVLTLVDDIGIGDAFYYDRAGAVRLGVETLIKAGHKKIAYLGKRPNIKYDYYQSVLAEYNLTPPSNGEKFDFPDIPTKRTLTEFFNQLHGVDALFITNYLLACQIVRSGLSLGLSVLDRYDIMAFGIESHNKSLPLSYVQVPYYELGKGVAKFYQEKEGASIGERKVEFLQSKLIIKN